MEMHILVIELGIKNLENLKKELYFEYINIIYKNSILESTKIPNIGEYQTIIISDAHGINSTIGYIKLIKKVNPSFKIIILTNDNEINQSHFSDYILTGADSYISIKNLSELKDRINHLYLNLSIIENTNNWKDCTKKVIKFLKQHYNKLNVNLLEVISSQVNYSASSISHYVKKDTGKSVKDWLQSLKVEGAIDLLNRTDYQIKYISNLVGYKSVQGLIKSLKRETGKTPNEFRKELKNSKNHN